MITEEGAVALMNEANPVPDLDSYDVVDPGVAAYLAELEHRSSEVTQLETKETVEKQRNRSPLGWLVAAVMVVVLGVALILMGQEEAPGPVDQTPTTLVESAPTTVPVPTTVPEVVEAPAGDWESIPVFTGLTAGRVRTLTFEPAFSFEVEEGWAREYGDTTPNVMFALTHANARRSADPIGGVIVFFQTEDSTVDAELSRFTEGDRFDTGTPEEVGVDGADGVRIETNPRDQTNVLARDGFSFGLAPTEGGHIVYILDVAGAIVLVVGEDRIGRQGIDEIVGSIEWRDLG